jgi:hypothetical protein
MSKNYTTAFVTYEGEYSSEADVLLFDRYDLTAEQWDMVGSMSDSSRYEYIRAVLDGRSLSQWEL